MVGRIFSTMLRLVISIIVVAITITILSLLPGFEINDAAALIIGIILLSLLNAHLYPLLIRLTLPLTVLSFGLISFILNGLMILLVAAVMPGWQVDGLLTAIFISIVFTFLFGSVVPGIMGRRDDELYRYEIVKRYANKAKKESAKNYERPGLMILEIDGLSGPALHQAIGQGYMPFIKSWLRSGEYKLLVWDSGLPSQTSAMQAGILHGSHFNIPAFRFYNKKEGVLLVSNRPKDAALMLSHLDDGKGILAENGFSLNNWAHGNAHEILLTFTGFSTEVGSLKGMQSSNTLFQFFAVAANMQRVIISAIHDLVTEYREARAQVRRDIEPRIRRHFPYPLVRTGTVAVLPYLSIYLLIGKMWEGISVAYTTFVSYDEVAHHSGVERSDAFKILTQLDEQVRLMVEASKQAPRKYEFVLLSDHGQSQGATFRQRYGMTLGELIDKSITDPSHAIQIVMGENASGNLNLLASQFAQSSRWAAKRVKALIKNHENKDYIELKLLSDKESSREEQVKKADTVVCASGNLALVYFKVSKERMTLEEIDAAFPNLVNLLSQHPGIGFVLVRSKDDGLIAVGSKGVYYLDSDTVDGENPLTHYGENAAMHLRELDTYPDVGDLVLISMYDPEWDEVAAFEELVGSHGGLGGDQNHPFIMFPKSFDPDNEIKDLIGAPAIYKLLKKWTEGR